ncbi:MAG: YicC family protein [Rhodospirillaceae bacterium]|nr:YicC family protein [Rhodospirillaceae bacterium]|tara:strand:+ start:16669 stop:17580 length:912 start_codon:yes stop_codon:yes gene_type:complete
MKINTDGNEMVSSMTGFASNDGTYPPYEWVWELKSLNSKTLDIRCRLGADFEKIEPEVRRKVIGRIKRGHIFVSLKFVKSPNKSNFSFNREMLNQAITLWKEYEASSNISPPRFDGLLSLRGVIDQVNNDEVECDLSVLKELILKTLEMALDDLVKMRNQEGYSIRSILYGHLSQIENLVLLARDKSQVRPDQIVTRFKKQLKDLLDDTNPVSEERLAQEITLLAIKNDVSEEIDRLQSHLSAARKQIEKNEPMGRKLDFLSQELNREVNTLCSKSNDYQLTETCLSMKLIIDQFREQVQNIE